MSAEKIHKAKQQWIGILIAMPALFILFKSMLPTLPSNPMLKEAFWAKKVSADASYDLVLIGDSRVYRGIDPVAIQAQTALKTLNFGFSSGGLNLDIIDKAMQHLNPQGAKCLLLAVSPNALLKSSESNGHYHQIADLSKADLYIQSTVYESLSALHAYALSDFMKLRVGEKYFEAFKLNTGFVYSNHLPYDSAAALYQYRQQFSKNSIDTTTAFKLLEAIVKLPSKGFQVVLCRVPTSLKMRQLEDQLTNDFVPRFLQQATQAGVRVLDLPIGPFHSYDGSHLDGASAVKLSKVIGDSLSLIWKTP